MMFGFVISSIIVGIALSDELDLNELEHNIFLVEERRVAILETCRRNGLPEHPAKCNCAEGRPRTEVSHFTILDIKICKPRKCFCQEGAAAKDGRTVFEMGPPPFTGGFEAESA